MPIAASKAGNLRMDTESSLGTAAGSAVYLRPESVELNRTMTRYLAQNHVAGHRNPYVREKPISYEKHTENALKLMQAIRRPTTDGGTPTIETLFKSAGWEAEVSTGETTTAGTPTTTAIDQTANVTDEGQAVLIEVTPGVFKPTLVANLVTDTITPSIALSAAPAAGEIIEVMHTFTPTTQYAYQVPSDQTLQMQYNSYGYYDDAYGDLSVLYTGCAVGSIDALEIGTSGSIPMFTYNIHAGKIDITADDIAAESFADSDKFVVITEDAEFAFATANAAGIGTLVTDAVTKLTVTPNVVVKPVVATGAGVYGDIVAYIAEPTPPTIEFEAFFSGDATLENKIITELESDNTSQYLHYIQPTRDLDVPAMGIWAPMCHLADDDSFSIQMFGEETIKCQAKFICSVTGFDSLTDIDEVEASPLFIAVSSEAA